MDQVGKFLLEHGLYDAAITLGNVQVRVFVAGWWPFSVPMVKRIVHCVPDQVSW